MTSGRWPWACARVFRRLRSLLPAACISCCIFGALKSVDSAFADEEKASVDPTSDAATKELREERLDYMRRSIRSTNVYRLKDGKRIAVTRPKEPLFRYSEHRIPILDATLWAWGGKGRPAALEKIELYPKEKWGFDWLHCFASLSDGLVRAEWPDGHRWSSKKPRAEIRALPNGPTPADSPVRRLIQMKNIARRFSSTVSIPEQGWEDTQRLLSRPVHRYSDPESALLDGAIFGFCTVGTGPDLLMFVELHGEQLSESVWKYCMVRMTNRQLNVRLDDREVWSVPHIPPSIKTFDAWFYFFEPRRADSLRSRSP